MTFEWEAPGVREVEAADLALEDLSGPTPQDAPDRVPSPTVNLFGPPVFGPGAAAEYAEAERLLALIGVEVNARVPLGASVETLAASPRAWVNVLLYREIGESATLYLQDEFGMQRVTTPMIGAAGTGAALRAVGELCHLDPNGAAGGVGRAGPHGEAPLVRPPRNRRRRSGDRRVAIFGDFTYPLGLGYALSREVGLEVAACGTYLGHLERDFLFHAHTFTDEAFVEDDPEEVAARIEASEPDLIVGTHLEEGVADSLDVPFLPLCPPTADRPFVERPLMGYAGSSVLADALDGALRGRSRSPTARATASSGPTRRAGARRDTAVSEGTSPAARRGDTPAEQGSTEVTREIFLESRS